MVSTLAFVTCGLYVTQAFVLDSTSPRKVNKILTVSNGGKWGSWHSPSYCADGTFAVGYKMKIEGNQGGGDDTSLNGVMLECHSYNDGYGGSIYSGEGPWGQWDGLTSCAGENEYLVAFSQQVEGTQGLGDDTASNFVNFKCRNFETSSGENVMDHGSGHGYWGSFGGWSESCPPNSAICGIQTKVEGSLGLGDDTSLNDMKMFCCIAE